MMMFMDSQRERERRWFVLERPRRDTNGGSETEVTVTSKLQANAERNKNIGVTDSQCMQWVFPRV